MIRKQYQDDHTKICPGHDKVVKARVEMINSLKINTKIIEVRKEIKELETSEMIEEINSHSSSPIACVFTKEWQNENVR